MAEDLAKNEFYMKKLRKECEVRDTDKDGFISKADFDLVLQRYKDMGYSEKIVKKLSDHYATLMVALGLEDSSSKLTYEETIANFMNAGNGLEALKKVIEMNFEVIDLNEDGMISFDEWVTMYKALGIDTIHARPSFDAMDANKDGVVSIEEFCAYGLEYYSSAEDKLKSSIIYGPLD